MATSYSEDVGSIEVLSNIKGARIIINGRDTGELTDNIFTQLPTGGYSVRIEKEGYGVEPESRTVRLSHSEPAANAIFTLLPKEELVKIHTDPKKAKIFIDGKFNSVIPALSQIDECIHGVFVVYGCLDMGWTLFYGYIIQVLVIEFRPEMYVFNQGIVI